MRQNTSNNFFACATIISHRYFFYNTSPSHTILRKEMNVKHQDDLRNVAKHKLHLTPVGVMSFFSCATLFLHTVRGSGRVLDRITLRNYVLFYITNSYNCLLQVFNNRSIRYIPSNSCLTNQTNKFPLALSTLSVNRKRRKNAVVPCKSQRAELLEAELFLFRRNKDDNELELRFSISF